MALNWPDFTKWTRQPDQVGDAVERMVNAEIAQSAANQRALQKAKADAAKQQAREERQTTAEVNRGR